MIRPRGHTHRARCPSNEAASAPFRGNAEKRRARAELPRPTLASSRAVAILRRRGRGRFVKRFVERIALVAAAVSWGLFASPAAAQQTLPDQTPPSVQQPQSSVPPAPPPERQATRELPPPFPPMPRRAPRHRWVSGGEGHHTQAHHRSKHVHHYTKRAHRRTGRTTQQCHSRNHRHIHRHHACISAKLHRRHAELHHRHVAHHHRRPHVERRTHHQRAKHHHRRRSR